MFVDRLRDWLGNREGPRHGIGSGGGMERICHAADEPRPAEARYSLAFPQVSPSPKPLAETEARHLITVLRPTHVQGPTRVALTIGSDEKTVRRAGDEETALRGDFFLDLLLADDHALDPALAHFGKMLIDLDLRPIALCPSCDLRPEDPRAATCPSTDCPLQKRKAA